MGLLKIIEDDYKKAFQGGDRIAVDILRILKAEFQNASIAKRGKGDDVLREDEVVGILRRLIKQSEEAKEMFQKGNRPDLVERNEKEQVIIKKYLPKMMAEDQVRDYVKKIVSEAGQSDFGKTMGQVMKDLKGKADGTIVSKVVKEIYEKA